jgi:N-dimethylarginine dimethylaminohydrolase
MTSSSTVLMCPPTYYTIRDVKNPFMQGAAGTVDSARALRQWDALREAFARSGVSTVTIDPVEDLEDMVFAANQTFVGSGALHPRFVVPSRMRFESREREVRYYVDWFVRNGFEIVDLTLNAGAEEFLEGHGDLITHPGAPLVWAGHGFRSSRAGVERFARAMDAEGIEVMPLELTDPTFYHLDTCFAPLHADAALVYPDALAGEALELLQRGWSRLHEVTRAEAIQFACNGVVAGANFIASHVTARLEGILESEGLHATIVDTSEFEKSGGSVFCMKTFVIDAGG